MYLHTLFVNVKEIKWEKQPKWYERLLKEFIGLPELRKPSNKFKVKEKLGIKIIILLTILRYHYLNDS